MTQKLIMEYQEFKRAEEQCPVIGIVLLLLAVLWFVHPTWLLSSVGGV